MCVPVSTGLETPYMAVKIVPYNFGEGIEDKEYKYTDTLSDFYIGMGIGMSLKRHLYFLLCSIVVAPFYRNIIYSSGQSSLMFNIEKGVLSSHTLFIRPHRKDIGHEHNPDTPRKSNPYIITNRLTRQ